MERLLKIHQEFSNQGILISFNGSLSNSIIEEIGDAIKGYLVEEKKGKGVVTDIFSAYIEQTHNIRTYIREHDIGEKYRTSIMIISAKDGKYQISSGNSIRKGDVPLLKSRLEQINSLDKEGLKQLYKEQRRRELDPDATSAGLGLISIARTALGGLEYRFDPQDDEYDFFSLRVTIPGE